MSDYDPKTNIHVTPGPATGGGGLYFIVGALVVAVPCAGPQHQRHR